MKTIFKKALALTLTFSMLLMGVNDAKAANVPKIKNIRIRQTGDSTGVGYKIVIIVKNDDADEVANVEVELTPADSSSPEFEKSKITLKEDRNLSTEDEKYFVNVLVIKENGVGSSAGHKYNVNATMYDAKNNTVGKTKSTLVTTTDKSGKCPYEASLESVSLNSIGGTIEINGGSMSIKGSANTVFKFGVIMGLNNTKESKPKEIAVELNTTNSNSVDSVYSTILKLNEKTSTYEGDIKLATDSKTSYDVNDITIAVQNLCDDYKYYEVNLSKYAGFGNGYTYFDLKKYNPEKENNSSTSANDSCKTKYKLSSVSTTTSNTSGLYTMAFQFAFDKGSDVPEKVVMVVQIKDCNGNTKNINIELKYNAKTGEYIGGQAIKQDSKCEWEIVDAEIGAYNLCDELSAWSLNISQYKSNGKGTRQVATANNGSPGLL